MTSKLTKYGIMVIAAVLLVGVVFAGAASAVPAGPMAVSNVQVADGKWGYTYETVNNAYTITSEEDWKSVVDNSSMWDKTFVLTQDITFSSSVNSVGTSSTKFTGTIYGNGSKFINFTQSGPDAHGLIYYMTGNCVLNNLHLYDSDIASSKDSNVGGLVGYIDNGDLQLVGCSVAFSNVTLSNDGSQVGGLVGYVFCGDLWVNASWVDHAYVKVEGGHGSYGYGAGGLVCSADASSGLYIADSWVNCSEIYASNGGAGGLVGYASTMDLCPLTNTTVSGCKVWSGGSQVGGLVGHAESYLGVNMSGSVVENCTVMSCGGSYVGGLVGYASESIAFEGETTWVNATWVGGTSDIGAVIGYDNGGSISGTTYSTQNVWGERANSSIPGLSNAFSQSPKTLDEAKIAGYCSPIDKIPLTAGVDYGYLGAPEIVAKIGDIGYTTVELAFDDAENGDTIVLLMDSTLAGDYIEVSGKEVTLDLNGSTLTEKANGWFFSVLNGATFTLMDSSVAKTGKLQGNGYHGGGTAGVSIYGSTFIMENGSIVDLRSANGGAVYVDEGRFTMNNGSIINCSTTDAGGAVYVNPDAEFNMTGGSIEDCWGKEAGAVLVYSGTFNMKGGSIVNCNATINGGGAVVAVESSVFNMTGMASIKYCEAAVAGGVWIGADTTFNMEDEASIINCNVTTDESGGAVYIEGGMFNMRDETSISYCNATNNGGAVYMAEGTFNMTGDASISYCNATNGGAVYLYLGTFNMTSGSISYCNATNNGGAVYVDSGTFNMTGDASISYCNATNGGAVYLCPGTFNMTDDTSISYCNATSNGGAVYVDDGCTFTMSNGSISDCTADWGGCVANYGQFTMSNGSISDCTASAFGGGVNNHGTFTMSGGSILECEAEYGGGVYVADTFTMSGGSITDCTASLYGGGIGNDWGTFTMSGGTIASCSAPIGSGVDQFGTFIVNGTATIFSDNDVSLYTEDGMYTNITVDADSGFTGSILNITLYEWDEGEDAYIESPKTWLQQIIVVNGADYADLFQLSPAYIDDEYELTASGDDLILTEVTEPVYKKKSSGQTGYTVILTATPTPVATSAPADVPTINPSVKPTTTTSASPAPFVGLALGLGAAAVLLRLRK